MGHASLETAIGSRHADAEWTLQMQGVLGEVMPVPDCSAGPGRAGPGRGSRLIREVFVCFCVPRRRSYPRGAEPWRRMAHGGPCSLRFESASGLLENPSGRAAQRGGRRGLRHGLEPGH